MTGCLEDGLLARNPRDREARSLEAHVLFFEGAYDEARKRLAELGARGAFPDLVRATAEAARDFRSRESASFRLSWGNPRDDVLADGALEALEAAREAVGRELGFYPEGRVRVEVYPTVASFTSVSTLTRDEVETSGTIGLCKFDRLMITSLRATLWGGLQADGVCSGRENAPASVAAAATPLVQRAARGGCMRSTFGFDQDPVTR